jgi:hypothetical protein
MKSDAMHRIGHSGCHDGDCPKAWREVPNLTGDYDLDATILHRDNANLPHRLNLYVKTRPAQYGSRSGYKGYHGNKGDD